MLPPCSIGLPVCHGARPVCLSCRRELVDVHGEPRCPECWRLSAATCPCPHPVSSRRWQDGRLVPVCSGHEIPAMVLVARVSG